MAPPVRSLRERFHEKYVIDEATGCWLWTAKTGKGGYGYIGEGRTGGRTLLAHRVSYELHIGPIPQGLSLDHLCRTRHCVNPEHLEAVTIRENTLRGDTLPAQNAAKTHCAKGHEFTPENTYTTKRGNRACRECQRAATREWREKQAAAA